MMDAEVREKLHLEILKRTGAYLANDHFLLPSGHHAREYIQKSLVSTEPSFTEGIGAIIAKHFAPSPVDLVLSTGRDAMLLAHCVAKAHPSRPSLIYATKGAGPHRRRVVLPAEFASFITKDTRVLIVEDLITTGKTIQALFRIVDQRGGRVIGVGCLWRRDSKEDLGKPVYSLVSREFPTYDSAECPLCRQGIPLNQEIVIRRRERTSTGGAAP